MRRKLARLVPGLKALKMKREDEMEMRRALTILKLITKNERKSD